MNIPGQRIAKIDELMLAAWSLVPFTKIHSWNWLLHDVILYTSLGKATDSWVKESIVSYSHKL